MTTNLLTSTRAVWARHWRLDPERRDSLSVLLAISVTLAVTVGILMAVSAGLARDDLGEARWWQRTLPGNVLLSSCVTLFFQLVYRGIERGLPAAKVKELAAWRDWRAAVLHSGIGLFCVTGGMVTGLTMIDLIWQSNALASVAGDASVLLQFVAVSVLISGSQWIWWRFRWKQTELQRRATEAQLQLLQAQIEPHFLFNTLANVQSLIDYDTGRAKQMLEAFTDYLRASLGQIRAGDTTLEAELEMAHSYLTLLQIRMGERLAFTIDASAEARRARLPPLLLQPLIENAIHHGLEPKVEGGTIRIAARVEEGRLMVEVDDDGRGLDAPRRPGRGGNGVALGNIRARLAHRFADNAVFGLAALRVGTRASLTMPFQTQPTAEHP